MDLTEALKELQNHQGMWMGVKDKKIVLAETRASLENKLNSPASVYQIPKMYYGYPAWRTEVEESLKNLMNQDAVQKHEQVPFIKETEDEVVMHIQTEDINEERPKRSFLQKILGI